MVSGPQLMSWTALRSTGTFVGLVETARWVEAARHRDGRGNFRDAALLASLAILSG